MTQEEIEFNRQDTLISEPKPRNKYQSDKDFRKFIVNKILELKTATSLHAKSLHILMLELDGVLSDIFVLNSWLLFVFVLNRDKVERVS